MGTAEGVWRFMSLVILRLFSVILNPSSYLFLHVCLMSLYSCCVTSYFNFFSSLCGHLWLFSSLTTVTSYRGCGPVGRWPLGPRGQRVAGGSDIHPCVQYIVVWKCVWPTDRPTDRLFQPQWIETLWSPWATVNLREDQVDEGNFILRWRLICVWHCYYITGFIYMYLLFRKVSTWYI